jgi:hypothetical protein
MEEIRGQTFAGGEQIETDGKAFVDCTFDKAQLRYAGGAHPTFTGCGFGETGWYFTDGALRTIQFLQQINMAEGGAQFIEGLFKPGQYITE